MTYNEDGDDNQDTPQGSVAPVIYGLIAVTIIGAWIYSDPSINLSKMLG